MRFSIRTLCALAALVLAAGAPAVADDLTIVSKGTHDGQPSTSISYLSGDHIRMAQTEGHETLMDMRTGQMTVLDGKKKTYYTITRQDWEQLKVKMQEQMNSPEMKRAQEKLKELPPEQRKKMEEMMGGIAGAFEVKKTGTTRRIAGYGCENWTITVGEISKTENCLTSELQFPMHAWDTFRDFAESMKNMMTAYRPMAKGMAEMQEKFKDMKGFPLATSTTVNIMGHVSTNTSEVTEIRRGPIPASAWEIPAGYSKVDNPMLKAFKPK